MRCPLSSSHLLPSRVVFVRTTSARYTAFVCSSPSPQHTWLKSRSRTTRSPSRTLPLSSVARYLRSSASSCPFCMLRAPSSLCM